MKQHVAHFMQDNKSICNDKMHAYKKEKITKQRETETQNAITEVYRGMGLNGGQAG